VDRRLLQPVLGAQAALGLLILPGQEVWLHAAAAAGFAGLVAVGVTLAIERWGGVVGGLLGTLPTTIVPAALGVYAQAPSLEAYRDTLCAAPAGMLLNALFLYLWRVLPPRLPPGHGLAARLGAMVVLSLLAWAAGALLVTTGLSAARTAGVALLPLAAGLGAAIVVLGGWACLGDVPAPPGRRPVGPGALVARGSLAAFAIGAAVLLSATGNALLAGMATVFPAIFLTTMVSLWLAQGEAVPGGAVGPMMLGSASVAAFALLATWSLPALGAGPGSVVAWLLAAGGVTVPATAWLRRRQRPARIPPEPVADS
jgi:hypothetical protein